MAVLVTQFFEITGVDAVPPTNLAELIPYLLTVAIAVFLVSSVFGLLGMLVRGLFSWRLR